MNYKKLNKKVPNLEHATAYSAGLDLCITCDANSFIPHTCGNGPYKPVEIMVGTGIAVEIPENHVGLVFVRSSIGTKKGITLANGTGVIDSDYRGEIKLALRFNKPNQSIDAYERVAQMVVVPYAKIEPTLVEELNETVRGEGGFGSTNKLDQFSAEIAKEHAKIKPWQEYWFITDSGQVGSSTWMDTNADIYRFNSGNAFKSIDEADRKIESSKGSLENKYNNKDRLEFSKTIDEE